MSAKVERSVDFVDAGRTQVRALNFTGEIEYVPDWEDIAHGVRARPWKFKDVDETLCDGALVEIQPGKRTPVQHVVSDTTFYEVPISGKLVFLLSDPDGNFSNYYFGNGQDASFMFEVKKGSTMCWFAVKNQDRPAEILEYEEPGFSMSELPTVPEDAKEFNDRPISPQLWEIIRILEQS